MGVVPIQPGTSHLTVLVALLVSVTACTSPPDRPSPTDPLSVTTTTTIPTSTTTVTLEQGLDDYEDCLDARGVSIGEVELDGLGRPRMARAMSGLDFSDPEVLVALHECGPELSTGALDLGADPVLRDRVQASLEELADCLRRQGVTGYPDPVPAFSGLGSPFPMSQIPWADPDLDGAVGACSSRLGPTSP
jgi:hypothetical protein